MNMRMPIERQKKVGKYIKIKRKEQLRLTNSAKWTQRGFCKDVCSPTSLVKLERGFPPRFYDTFDKIAEKFDCRVDYDPKIERKINRLIHHVRDACELGDLQLIQHNINLSFRALEPVKDCLWYSDMYKMLELVEDYYMRDFCIKEDFRDYYNDLMSLYEGPWCELMKNVLYNSAFDDIQCTDYMDLYKAFEFDKMSDTCYNYINAMNFCLSRNNGTLFKDIFETAISRFVKHNNYIRLLDAYTMALTFAGIYDKNEIDELMEKIDGLIDDSVPETKISTIYWTLATVCYDEKEYDKALKMLEECYLHDVNRSHCPYLLVGNINHIKGFKSNIPYYHEDFLKNASIDLKRIYRYYMMDEEQNVSYEAKQSYLMEELLPVIGPEDDLTLDVLSSELDMLIKRTKKFDDLITFNETKNMLLYGVATIE